MAPDDTRSGKEKSPTPKVIHANPFHHNHFADANKTSSSFDGRHSIHAPAGDSTTRDVTAVPAGPTPLAMPGGIEIEVQAQNQPVPQMNASSFDESGTGPITPRARGIFFTIRNIDHKYDLDRPISAARIRGASLSDIFGIVSQHSGIPLKTIDRMTLKSIFAKKHVENIVDVLHKGADEQTWHDVKEKIRRRYEVVVDNDPSQEKFEIRVDVGDIPDVASKDMYADELLW